MIEAWKYLRSLKNFRNLFFIYFVGKYLLENIVFILSLAIFIFPSNENLCIYVFYF